MSELIEATLGVKVDVHGDSHEARRHAVARKLGIDVEHIASVEAVNNE